MSRMDLFFVENDKYCIESLEDACKARGMTVVSSPHIATGQIPTVTRYIQRVAGEYLQCLMRGGAHQVLIGDPFGACVSEELVGIVVSAFSFVDSSAKFVVYTVGGRGILWFSDKTKQKVLGVVVRSTDTKYDFTRILQLFGSPTTSA